MPTLAIVGAGPGLGASLARRFGRDGYRVALISRNPASLTERLRGDGVDAYGYPADVLVPRTLHDALTSAAEDLGGVDFLEYSPAPGQAGPLAPVAATDLTVESVSRQIEYYLYGGITAVQAVLPAMISRGSGTIVVSTGASSGPVIHPPFGNIAAATAALRNWTLHLHAALAPQGIYAAHVAIAAWIGRGGPKSDPDVIAESYAELVRDRTEPELFYLDESLSGL
ncbi:SDR family NAD(P)-dependent oxidoreductase [Catenuloplanes japonicus]|uniref:SDR family NAD(P)-dependent oxidoreductase n=1 Tax=Catenuloplanes japonicus TaxID=33876 RepID=UPI0005243AE7|nr:SDR family NAD(P)-dependent oxidoreductase [Catenuloplanes japonicus]